MKLGSIICASHMHMPMLLRASKNLDFLELNVYSSRVLSESPEKLDEVLEMLTQCDAIFLYRSNEDFWERIEKRLKEISKKIPIVCIGYDPSYWMLSTVRTEIVATVNSYITIGGEENFTNMLRYIGREVCGLDIEVETPKPVPWEGLYHPKADTMFSTVDKYLAWYKPKNAPTVGILFFRDSWVNDKLEIVNTLIGKLEKLGLNVIPAFSYSLKDEEMGCKGSAEVVYETFLRKDGTSRIDALIKMQFFLMGSSRKKGYEEDVAEEGVQILKQINVPVFCPYISYYETVEEWRDDLHGLNSSLIGFLIAMPEFEGVIEPFIIGGASNKNVGLAREIPIEERCQKLARRVANWISLRQKSVEKRKVAFILHNNPCASVEATVGGGAHLDTLESISRIMQKMKDVGYNVNPPKDGKELIDTIMERKAISEFRWTTVDEIVRKGGVLKQMTKEEYVEWFETLSPKIKKHMNDTWGNPPGEEKNGVPAAMVYNDKILITGIQYGNAVVCVQPKRGCAGARCDGQVCKILHDPEIPPPHQYMATYRWIENGFGADVIIHVGTHGNLEFLPGKSVALSESCYPDIAIGDIPHLYIYNSDNPPEGTIAKRRSYATLIDHMQTVMTEGSLYGDLKELENQIAEYNKTKISDKARAHALEHIIIDILTNTNLSEDINLDKLMESNVPFEKIVDAAHEAITKLYNTQIPDGMHIFGDKPKGERKIEFINSILKHDSELRKLVFDLLGLEIEPTEATSEMLTEIDQLAKEILNGFLSGKDPVMVCKDVLGSRLNRLNEAKIFSVKSKVDDISSRIDASDEIGALLHGFDAGYIEPGPSGLITRGKPEILPTGRNFYSLDPYKVPTKAAWRIGQKLADGVIKKYVDEHGKFPENIAMYWMCTDIMWADGEQLAQIMHLIGVEPIWNNGKVEGYKITPLKELNRPRIDVTIRVSGITRDNFYNCIELIDDAIKEVSMLNEPEEMNYLKKHANDTHIFSSKPGTYMSGVNFAVYASAWKEEKDLSDVFIYWNGYAYGKGVFGVESHDKLVSQLKTVDLTFNKTVTDEYDLIGCCCYFGTHGGLTTAAREISGHEVSVYYGDTRDQAKIEVRSLADEVRRIVRSKLLNPKWIEGMKRHGYKGAGDISQRIGRVYGWEATTQEVDDWIFNDIARTFVLDEKMRKFFQENNPWALEEIGRRLLEAHQRKLWDADPEVLEGLKNAYLEIESWLEEKMGDVQGDFQGGSIDILTSEYVENWGSKMREIKEKLHEVNK